MGTMAAKADILAAALLALGDMPARSQAGWGGPTILNRLRRQGCDGTHACEQGPPNRPQPTSAHLCPTGVDREL